MGINVGNLWVKVQCRTMGGHGHLRDVTWFIYFLINVIRIIIVEQEVIGFKQTQDFVSFETRIIEYDTNWNSILAWWVYSRWWWYPILYVDRYIYVHTYSKQIQTLWITDTH